MLLIILLLGMNLCIRAEEQQPQAYHFTLAQCREMALGHNGDLTRALLDKYKAGIDTRIAKTGFLPTISATATDFFMYPDLEVLGMTIQNHGSYAAGISLAEPIYMGGKIRNGNKLAKVGLEAAEMQETLLRDKVVMQVDQTYWNYVSLLAMEELLQECMSQLDTLAGISEAGVGSGMITPDALLQIQAKQAEIKYQYQLVESNLDVLRQAICLLTGLNTDTPLAIDDKEIKTDQLPPLLDTLQRTEVKLLEKKVEANELQVKMVRADMLPSIAFTAGYVWFGNMNIKSPSQDASGNQTTTTNKIKGNLGTAAISLSVPITHFGEKLYKVKKAQLDVIRSQVDLEENTRNMRLERDRAQYTMHSAYSLILMADKAEQLNKAKYQAQRDRFENGMGTITDLLEAQMQWQQAGAKLIDAKAQYKIAESDYYRTCNQLK